MSTPRDHHFIPVFYLKQWVGSSGKLIEYSIKHGKLVPKPVGPRGTGFETDLYSFPELPTRLAQFVEADFMKYTDNEAAMAVQKQLREENMSGDLRSAWCRFLIGFHLRHPDTMKELRPAAAELWKKTEHEFQRRDPLIGIKFQAIEIVRAFFDDETFGRHIFHSHWAVMTFSRVPNRLLTSDRPLAMHRLHDPMGYISLPISPTQIFVAANDERTLSMLEHVSPKNLVHRFNVFTVSRARRYVYAMDETQERFIRNRMSTAMEPAPLVRPIRLP
jgi:Protein of unknown function (DUF4238)